MVSDDWRLFRLGDLCTKIGSGATPRGGKDVYLERGPFSLIRSQNVYSSGFRRDGLSYIGHQHAAELAQVEVREKDVLLNITGDSVARACQVDPAVLPARVNQHVAILRPDPAKLDASFLRYLLVAPAMQTRLLSWASAGGTRNALTKGMIESLEFPLPPLPEQKRIAHILGTLDDKIELNRRMCQTLEEMARALFKSWFVDFDPVRAKAEGRQPAGMDAATAALFPDSFADSELGPIPEGWEVKAIGDVVEVVGGSTPSTSVPVYWDGPHSFATPKDLSSLRTHVLLDTERRITHEGLARISSGLLPVGTVLLSSRAPIGYLAVAQIPVAVNQGFIAMKCSPGMPSSFVLLWARQNLETIIGSANGTTFLEISKRSFRPIPALLPRGAVLEAFARIVEPMFRLVAGLERQNWPLSAARDVLLPRLLSGVGHVDSMDAVGGQAGRADA